MKRSAVRAANRAMTSLPTRMDIELPLLGRVALAATDKGLCGLGFPGLGDDLGIDCTPGSTALLRDAAKQLQQYATGKRTAFDLPFDLSACTQFTRDVLAACAKIPFSKVETYGEVALAIGKPGAARAVGGALGRNPVAIIVPCHRVVAGNGIGGFTAGLHIKRLLWTIEAITLPGRERPAPRAVPRAVRRG